MVAMESTYVDLGEAALMLECTVQDVRRYIGVGLLDRYRYKGVHLRVRRSQVTELAQVDPELLRVA